ncbi:ImmA/IrrE family metallo-endopeptidase [Cohnella sp. REN36]|uniref:ImmA/IrrE family metallo-endopeptidase n=1 Tax=Cohnella sp. REN36 TaxID=2887347 RepID=UPI001D15044A|nr:ImmA/IrrE family metallo-endopeptidase [Cohnella sp. REN36]MCC3374728.1 ImmA/IrrE family metallo-endopeptidase [Cohnella sp. REN36]
MLQYYHPTPLEQWIETLWTKAGIASASQLTIEEVAGRLNVWVHYLNYSSRALEWMGLRSILIDRRLSRAEQWEDFLHELCHLLRHAGNQTVMPLPFLEHQEAEAKRFVLYASMPYYLIKELKLPDRQGDAIELLSSRFGVTYTLASQRLEQFQRRAFEAILWEEAGKAERILLRRKAKTEAAKSPSAVAEREAGEALAGNP